MKLSLGPFLGATVSLCLLSACAEQVGPTELESTEAAAETDTEAALEAAIDEQPFEVWAIDQSDTNGLTYGGTLYIYDGQALSTGRGVTPAVAEVIDLGGDTASLCFDQTGANPVRPHMIFFNAARTHAVLSFVASGHVVIFDAATRAPVACLRASAGADGARQAHAAVPAPDDSYILVANQNGKLLERISTDYAAGTFAWDPAAKLNLATCVAPSGDPCQFPGIRPDNAPICPIIDGAGAHGFITLRGGGLFVVDPAATPIQIVGEYDVGAVHGNGCGGVEAGGAMFINSGGGTAANLDQFDVYRFPLSGYAPTNPVNTPPPQVVFTDGSPDRDAHGMLLTKRGRTIWVLDRIQGVAEVFNVNTNAHVATVDLKGPLSSDPAPDLMDLSPSGNRIFVTLRGPTPLSGDPHASVGSTPGVGVVQVTRGGKRGKLKRITPITNIDAGGVQRADPHAIRVRLL
ncbi:MULTISPECIES: hypothetical protein [Sorangium]|uniref:Secreted protein n=1 Tax=Sorangium cellulosum TaxID=56 RepID=A0A4P2QKZ7_SORCE|nr:MULTISPECIES: hypothetical protein [Sorangium]AUX30709.1 uncharacterized protein SOCE836_028200 [Sorangium cellulosum]WCQ90096.1 hypothetical protein NQZ70_02797 [Sorangium sp. Soce836]